MTTSCPLPRVFVSSVIGGFETVRECARDAISSAGAQPVLVEDFGAEDASPRNACLDAVDSCDACVVIIGSRGGSKAPSGKLIVEEEFEEAARRTMPTLLYLEDVDRDTEADTLATKLSSFVDGRLRATFRTHADLSSRLSTDLPPVIERLRMRPTDPRAIQTLLLPAEPNNRGETQLRTVIAAERGEPIEAIIDTSNLKLLYALAHDCDLFSFESLKQHHEGADSLTLTQVGQAGPSRFLDRVVLIETGVVTIDSMLGQRDREVDWSDGGFSHMIIPAEQIEERMGSALSFVGLLFERFDPYARHVRFLYNAAFTDYEGKVVERNPKPRHGMSIPMYQSTDGIIAFREPRSASRADLVVPAPLVTLAVNRIVRQLSAAV